MDISKKIKKLLKTISNEIQPGSKHLDEIESWKSRLENTPVKPWSFVDKMYGNSPHDCISPKIRWKIVRDQLATMFKPQESHGIDLKQWEKLYLDSWYQEMEKLHPGAFKQAKRAIMMHSERPIAIKRGLNLACGLKFKRGDRGNELNKKALDEIPKEIANGFVKAMIEKDTKLCHVQGYIITLPEVYFRYVVK